MNILVAPDAFKGTATSAQAARQIASGVGRALRDAGIEATVDTCPVSDGGAGFVDAMVEALQGERRTLNVEGPLGSPVSAQWGRCADLGVIEASAAAGLELVPESRRDPAATSTFGVGQLIEHAMEIGCTEVLLGIGNSATCDGGIGAVAAMGVAVRDRQHGDITRPTGKDLCMLGSVAFASHVGEMYEGRITIACDVTNPLLGDRGSAPVFGPQKGASPEQVELLEAGLARLVEVLRGSGFSPEADEPGAGAAGGLGFGLRTLFGAAFVPGAPLVLEKIGFENRIAGCDLLITGEGSIDAQTGDGKLVHQVAEVARRVGVRVVAVTGHLGAGGEAMLREHGGALAWVSSLARTGEPLDRARVEVLERLELAGEACMRWLFDESGQGVSPGR